MKRALLFLTVLGAVAAWPAASSAATGGGTVVAKQHGLLLVASPSGVVNAFAGKAAIGARVRVAGGHVQVVGRTRTARIHGVVIRRLGATLFVSSNRHLIAMRTGRAPAAVADTAPPASGSAAPQPGQVVTSQVTIANGQLEEQDEQQLGTTGAVQVTATVAAVAAGSVTLTVEGQSLVVPLPGGLTLPASLVGQTVTIQLTFGGNTSSGDDDGSENGNASVIQPQSTGQIVPQPPVTTQGTSPFTGHGDHHGGNNGGDGGDGGGDN